MLSKINEVGWGTTVTAFLLNVGNTVLEWKVNEVLTVLISIFSLVYLLLKITEKVMAINRQRRIDRMDDQVQNLISMQSKIKEAISHSNSNEKAPIQN